MTAGVRTSDIRSENTLKRRFRYGSAVGAFAFVTLGMSQAASADAIVIVADDAGYQASTVRTLRSIVATELRSHGVAVLDDARFDAATAVGAETLQSIEELGAEQVFVLRLGRLESKVFMSLEELNPPSLTPVFVSRLTATGVDEADKVIGRLVTSVLSRQDARTTARVATVTEGEAEAFKKRPGEGLFIIGVGLAPLGGSIGWSHEVEHWRLGVLLQGDEDVSFFGVDGAWLPSDNNISPYVGVGLGVVEPDCDGYRDGSGYGCDDRAVLGTKIEAGVELFRLHGLRLMVGAHAVIPFASRVGSDRFNPGIHVRVGF
jgi:hypothetical protein